ncbi:MAG: protein kinase [Chloroflexota bacterium]
MSKLLLLGGSKPADEGESIVTSYLEANLPGTYTIIPNIEIVQRGQPAFEYDLVVIAPHVIYVVEVKRWRGGIQGDDYSWLVAGLHRRQNPWPTTNNKARVLKSQIVQRLPLCASIHVEAVVAIADDQAILNLRGHCRDRVFRYTELSGFLTDPTPLGSLSGNWRTERGSLEKAITELARGRQQGPMMFGEYQVLETIARRDDVTEYLARNRLLRSSEAVRLRVFSYNPYLDSSQLARRKEIISREAEALQRIGPHPNLIAYKGYFTAPDDPNLFVEVTDWSEEGTLRAAMSENAPDAMPVSLERKLEIAQGIVAGLRAVHSAQVVHRDLRPEHILIGRDGEARIMSFDHARLALPAAGTVGPIQPEPGMSRAYLAPELINPTLAPTPAADLYALGVIMFEMLVGAPIYDSPEDALRGRTSAGGPTAFGVNDLPIRLNTLVQALTHPDPARRPQNAQTVLDELHAILRRPSQAEPEPATPSHINMNNPHMANLSISIEDIEPAVFAIGNLIDGKYAVQHVLNEGGSGRVYKVYDEIFDQVYALKVFNSTSLSLDFLKKEVQAIKDIDHPNIVRVNGWGKLAQSNRLYLISEFVEGEDLTRFTQPDHHLPAGEAVRVTLDLLSALEALHPPLDRIQELRELSRLDGLTEEQYAELSRLQGHGWLHRDIKPANLMLTRDRLKLVDFNISSKASEAGHTYVGTRGYMLPDTGIMEWNTDGDLFAAGLVLYELITGHHPYPNREPNGDDDPADPRQFVPDLHPNLVGVLLASVSCDPSVRFHSAARFSAALRSLDGVYLIQSLDTAADTEIAHLPIESVAGGRNPYVKLFLTLYSQARVDNSGTRGLPEAARLTYVDTRLDRDLRPAILSGKYRLVIITGNAGDGKTAFIQSLEEQVKREGGSLERVTDNSTRFIYSGVPFYTNYDGSQDEGDERANDLVLTEFFQPFSDAHTQLYSNVVKEEAGEARLPVHLIAINEGRLIDFLGNSRTSAKDSNNAGPGTFFALNNAMLRYFNPEEAHATQELPDWLLIVDLNQRSVVARDPEAGDSSVFERQLMALLKPEFWSACEGCPLSSRCFIKYNVDSLSDSASGASVRERIRTMLEVVHLRRQLHITMRDMRSAISWMLFRDHTCEDVAALVGRADESDNNILDGDSAVEITDPAAWLDLLYYNAFARQQKSRAHNGRTDDRLVRLLRQIDPAEVANPATDTQLNSQGLDGLSLLTFQTRAQMLTEGLSQWQLPTGWEASQRIESVQGHRDRHALLRRVAYFERRDDDWLDMLPYAHLADFRKYTQSIRPDFGSLKRMLAEGISLAEGARNNQLAQRYVCLRAGETSKVAIKSFRLFPVEDFKVYVPENGGPFLEYTPDKIVFYHDPRDPSLQIRGAKRAELVVSLDVLELLFQVQKGFIPSLDDVRGFFVNLVIFRNALSHLPYRQVVLTRDDGQYYEIALRGGGVVELHPWSAERELEKERTSQ